MALLQFIMIDLYYYVAPVARLVTSKPYDTLGREFEYL